MTIVTCGACGVKVKVPESRMGGHDKCPSCAKDLFPRTPLLSEGNNQPSSATPRQGEADSSLAHLAKIEELLERMVVHLELAQRAKEYKVVIINNKFLTAQFDPAKIATLLNGHARNGWSVKGMVEFDPPSFTGDARAVLVLLERGGDPQTVPSAQHSPTRDGLTEEDRVALEFLSKEVNLNPEDLR
jgi:hypothetical protein